MRSPCDGPSSGPLCAPDGREEVGAEADGAPSADRDRLGSGTTDGAHIGKRQRLQARIARLEAIVQALGDDQQPDGEAASLREHEERARPRVHRSHVLPVILFGVISAA